MCEFFPLKKNAVVKKTLKQHRKVEQNKMDTNPAPTEGTATSAGVRHRRLLVKMGPTRDHPGLCNSTERSAPSAPCRRGGCAQLRREPTPRTHRGRSGLPRGGRGRSAHPAPAAGRPLPGSVPAPARGGLARPLPSSRRRKKEKQKRGTQRVSPRTSPNWRAGRVAPQGLTRAGGAVPGSAPRPRPQADAPASAAPAGGVAQGAGALGPECPPRGPALGRGLPDLQPRQRGPGSPWLGQAGGTGVAVLPGPPRAPSVPSRTPFSVKARVALCPPPRAWHLCPHAPLTAQPPPQLAWGPGHPVSSLVPGQAPSLRPPGPRPLPPRCGSTGRPEGRPPLVLPEGPAPSSAHLPHSGHLVLGPAGCRGLPVPLLLRPSCLLPVSPLPVRAVRLPVCTIAPSFQSCPYLDHLLSHSPRCSRPGTAPWRGLPQRRVALPT